MSAAPDIVRVEDIQSDNLSIILRYAGIALGGKEVSTGFFRQAFFLGKGNAVFHHFIPDCCYLRKIGFLIFPDFHFHILFSCHGRLFQKQVVHINQ